MDGIGGGTNGVVLQKNGKFVADMKLIPLCNQQQSEKACPA